MAYLFVCRVASAGTLYQDQGLIFATLIGALMHPSNIDKRSVKPLLIKARLRPIRFHDLRHTCATLMLSQGVNPNDRPGAVGTREHLADDQGRASSLLPSRRESVGPTRPRSSHQNDAGENGP